MTLSLRYFYDLVLSVDNKQHLYKIKDVKEISELLSRHGVEYQFQNSFQFFPSVVYNISWLANNSLVLILFGVVIYSLSQNRSMSKFLKGKKIHFTVEKT